VFVARNNEEVEVQPDMVFEGGEAIAIRIDVRKREFALGERFSISAADFDEIAFACSQFATELGQGLSKKLAPPGASPPAA
jgi:hypothetical protein